MSSLFCRHNRFTAECPICSKNSVLARPAPAERTKPAKPARSRSGTKKRGAAAADTIRYPHVAVGPIEHEARVYEVRLEKVPGALRLGEWRNGELERRAPQLPAAALRGLFDDARGHGYVGFDLPEVPAAVDAAGADAPGAPTVDSVASPGRSGDMQEELRLVRAAEPGFLQVARWVFWPGGGVGWELHEAPVMMPEARFAEVLSRAAEAGLI